ncbi:MAG TPA: response regulator transcription factor [Bacteroidetes bacterium]|nr:response regulator transcription factor [Bacteroidota bacterium]
MCIRIAIIEDQQDLLENLRELLESYSQIEIVFTAINGVEAVRSMEFYHDKVDLLLMDIEMPEMNGIEATRILRGLYPTVRILMLTVFERQEHLMQAIEAGASGYLLKGEKAKAIVQSIEQAMEGRLPLSPVMAAQALSQLQQNAQSQEQAAPLRAFSLSGREEEVFGGLVRALTYVQIAEELFISPKTVRRHMENIYKKLDVHSKVEAIRLAHQNSWFS